MVTSTDEDPVLPLLKEPISTLWECEPPLLMEIPVVAPVALARSFGQVCEPLSGQRATPQLPPPSPEQLKSSLRLQNECSWPGSLTE